MARAITAHSNPIVKRARGLREKKGRRAEHAFLAEGLRIVTEAHDAGKVPETIFFARESAGHPLVARLVAAVEAAGGDAIETVPDILARLSGKDNPQSVVGVFAEFPTALATLDRARADIWLVAERLRDPGNLGTMLRTADAIGAGGLILLDDCADPFSVEAVRASMGALFTVALAQARFDEFVGWLRAGPGQLVGTSLRATCDYRAPRYAAPVFLLAGNEAQGLPERCEAACDLLVRIPMRGRADSLNVAVATAVMAYEVFGQQAPLPAERSPDA